MNSDGMSHASVTDLIHTLKFILISMIFECRMRHITHEIIIHTKKYEFVV